MKVGFVQLSPVMGDLKTTMATIEKLVSRIPDADLIVLPELCNSGYNFKSKKQAYDTAEVISESVFIKHLISLCRLNNVHIVSGFNERDKNRLYNTAVLVGPDGYMGRYRKLHLFLNEKDFFTPGNIGLPVFDIGGCRIGMLICFDWIFPEVWRIVALKGADIICHPSNLVIPHLAQKAVPVLALMNRVYTITANRFGTEGDLTFTGLSTLAAPDGEVLYQASVDKEEAKAIEIDVTLARNKNITARNHLFKDRRPDEYHMLVESFSGSFDISK